MHTPTSRLVENETMLEAHTREAFEQAASAYFPDGAIRAKLRENQLPPPGVNIWIPMPRNQKRKYYRKFSSVNDGEITPQIGT